MTREFGDFQTPLPLVQRVLRRLTANGERWTRVLEPTCGRGNFIQGMMQQPAFAGAEIVGIELQPHYVQAAHQMLAANPGFDGQVRLLAADIFKLELRQDLSWTSSGRLLVVGNPPWVTNAELGTLGSTNLPQKSNLKGLAGLEALTGSANFDIAEYIWLKLIQDYQHEDATIALLCKTAVARNLLTFALEKKLPIAGASIWRIDARRWFEAAVEACLLRVDIGPTPSEVEIPVYASLDTTEPDTIMGMRAGRLVVDVATYGKLEVVDGRCPRKWRQGVKHDAASVMELQQDGNDWVNKDGETVMVEEDFLYPLLKGSDVFHGRVHQPDKRVIIPQRFLGQDTSYLARTAPRLWDYLQAHADIFERRKSSIYRHRPRFSIFGIGDYSFAPYKVAVAGLYKSPVFRLLMPVDGQPVMLDDTCYFLPCASLAQAALLTALLNYPLTLAFIKSVSFADAKRPVTKKILQRIDLLAIVEQVGSATVIEQAQVMLAGRAPDTDIEETDWPAALEEVTHDYSATPLLL